MWSRILAIDISQLQLTYYLVRLHNTSDSNRLKL